MKILVLAVLLILVANMALAQPPAPPPTPGDDIVRDAGEPSDPAINQSDNETNETDGKVVINDFELEYDLNEEEEKEMLETLENYGLEIAGKASESPTIVPSQGMGIFSKVLMILTVIIVLGVGGVFAMKALPRENDAKYEPVLHYLRENIAKGYDKDQLFGALKQSGWTEKDLEKCMAKL